MNDCIFCKIVAGEMDADVVYRDEMTIAFKDIHPLAPVHVLVVPIEHIDSLTDVESVHEGLLGHLMRICNEVAGKMGIRERGYRVVVNCGEEGGQVVPHLHMHVLGGLKLGARIV